MEGVMRGLVKAVAAPSSLVYHDDLPIPQIKDDEVLIKVHCTAICGSDIHILDWDACTEVPWRLSVPSISAIFPQTFM